MTPPRKSKNIALDSDGNRLPFTPLQVYDIVMRALRKGDLILVAMRTESGEIACHVLGEPSEEIAAMLEATALAYRRGLSTPEHEGS